MEGIHLVVLRLPCLAELDWKCFFFLMRRDNRSNCRKSLSANNKINPQIIGVDADIIGNLSKDDDDGGENVAKK